MHSVVRAWGNSYAIRLRKADLVALGLKPGMEVEVDVRAVRDRVDLSDVPTFRLQESLTEARTRAAADRSRRWQE